MAFCYHNSIKTMQAEVPIRSCGEGGNGRRSVVTHDGMMLRNCPKNTRKRDSGRLAHSEFQRSNAHDPTIANQGKRGQSPAGSAMRRCVRVSISPPRGSTASSRPPANAAPTRIEMQRLSSLPTATGCGRARRLRSAGIASTSQSDATVHITRIKNGRDRVHMFRETGITAHLIRRGAGVQKTFVC